MARELLILMLASSIFLGWHLTILSSQDIPRDEVKIDKGYAEIVSAGEARVYPLNAVPMAAKSGDSVRLGTDGSYDVGSMSGGRLILFGLPLDLNRASAKDLSALPGIGPKSAAAIVETRRRLGRFESIDDLIRVRGIGSKTLQKIRAYVKI